MQKVLVLLSLAAAALIAQERPVVLKTSTLYDGKGKALHNTIVVVEGSKIARLGGTGTGQRRHLRSRRVYRHSRMDRHARPHRESLRQK